MVECLYSVPHRTVIYVGYVDIGTRNNSLPYTCGIGGMVDKALYTTQKVCIIL